MQLKMAEVLILILIATIVSIIIELNKLSLDLEKKRKKRKSSISYISDASINVICGISMALALILVTENSIIWILGDIIGCFIGTKTFKIILKIINISVGALKNTDIEDLLDEDKKDGK